MPHARHGALTRKAEEALQADPLPINNNVVLLETTGAILYVHPIALPSAWRAPPSLAFLRVAPCWPGLSPELVALSLCASRDLDFASMASIF